MKLSTIANKIISKYNSCAVTQLENNLFKVEYFTNDEKRKTIKYKSIEVDIKYSNYIKNNYYHFKLTNKKNMHLYLFREL